MTFYADTPRLICADIPESATTTIHLPCSETSLWFYNHSSHHNPITGPRFFSSIRPLQAFIDYTPICTYAQPSGDGKAPSCCLRTPPLQPNHPPSITHLQSPPLLQHRRQSFTASTTPAGLLSIQTVISSTPHLRYFTHPRCIRVKKRGSRSIR